MDAPAGGGSMSAAPIKLSIIIPVYNEEQTIGEVVERVRAVDLGAIDKEIIIANDGSSDGTQLAIDASRWRGDPRIDASTEPDQPRQRRRGPARAAATRPATSS